jgi:hypothetical protein
MRRARTAETCFLVLKADPSNLKLGAEARSRPRQARLTLVNTFNKYFNVYVGFSMF